MQNSLVDVDSMVTVKLNASLWMQTAKRFTNSSLPLSVELFRKSTSRDVSKRQALNDNVPGAAPSFCMRNYRRAGEVEKERKAKGDKFVQDVYKRQAQHCLTEGSLLKPEPGSANSLRSDSAAPGPNANFRPLTSLPLSLIHI